MKRCIDPSASVAGDAVTLVVLPARVHDLQVAVEILHAHPAALEVEGQLEQRELPRQRRGAEQRARRAALRPEGGGEVGGGQGAGGAAGGTRHGPGLRAHLGDGAGEVMDQVDAVAPARVVRLPDDADDLTEIPLGGDAAGEQRVVEEAVVEDHGGLAAAALGFVHQPPAIQEILLGHVLLAGASHERLLQEEPLRVVLQHAPSPRRTDPSHASG